MRRVGGVLVALVGCAMIVPFLYMIATAFMGEFEVLRYPPPLLPARLHPENFASALTALPFGRFFLNSAIFSVGVVAGQDETSATAAYAFARLPFPGRDREGVRYRSGFTLPAGV